MVVKSEIMSKVNLDDLAIKSILEAIMKIIIKKIMIEIAKITINATTTLAIVASEIGITEHFSVDYHMRLLKNHAFISL